MSKNNNSHYFISLVPSQSDSLKRGSPTHYARHRGVEKLDWKIAAHIAREFNRGNAEPELFFCAWRDPDTNEINVGIEVPRGGNVSTSAPQSPSAAAEPTRHNLAHLFE
jgi:hypothetical protein